MNEDRNERQKPQTEIDPLTGTELHPGSPATCKGNGKHTSADGQPFPLCCDECDHYLTCFPEYEAPTTRQ